MVLNFQRSRFGQTGHDKDVLQKQGGAQPTKYCVQAQWTLWATWEEDS